MTEDKLTRDQRIALESVAQARVTVFDAASPITVREQTEDERFALMMERAAKIERFIRKRDDGAVDGVPALAAECAVCRQGAGNDCAHFTADNAADTCLVCGEPHA